MTVAAPATALLATIVDNIVGVVDPELPFVTIGDLGIVEAIETITAIDGAVTGVRVTILPTYLGCPAVEQIRADIAAAVAGVVAVAAAGCTAVVDVAMTPAWSTDRITDRGRARLAAAGIAPAPRGAFAAVDVGFVACPRCGSHRTHQVAFFGGTACMAAHICDACREPFDRFKPL